MPFVSPLQIELQDIRVTNTNRQHPLGQAAYTHDGRIFVFGQAGAVALIAGKLAQVPVVVPNHQALVTVTGAGVGGTKITVTLGGTAATADQYKDGFAVIRDTASVGAGQALPIVGNSAQTVTTGNVDVYLAEGTGEAITTASVVNLELAPTGGVLVSTTADTTERVVGVPQVDVPAASYAWFQIKGVASVLGNGSITKGTQLIKSATVAGAVDAEGTSTITQRVGVAEQTGTDAKYNTVYLNI